MLSLSDSAHDSVRAARGKEKFAACAACHGPEAKGNQALGAPNLTDKIWLYGGTVDAIMQTITNGRGSNSMTPGLSAMPAWKASLDDARDSPRGGLRLVADEQGGRRGAGCRTGRCSARSTAPAK